MEFLNELLQNQQNTFIGLGLALIVLLGIYMKLLYIGSKLFNFYYLIIHKYTREDLLSKLSKKVLVGLHQQLSQR